MLTREPARYGAFVTHTPVNEKIYVALGDSFASFTPNNGWDSQLGEMTELAVELEMQTLEMMQSLDALHQVLSKLTDLLPETAFDMDD